MDEWWRWVESDLKHLKLCSSPILSTLKEWAWQSFSLTLFRQPTLTPDQSFTSILYCLVVAPCILAYQVDWREKSNSCIWRECWREILQSCRYVTACWISLCTGWFWGGLQRILLNQNGAGGTKFCTILLLGLHFVMLLYFFRGQDNYISGCWTYM